MRSRLQRCCGALALVGFYGMAWAAVAQTPGGEAAGLTKEQVLELETALARLNFDPGEIDGVIDERTQAAIRLYQDFAALPADANATPALLAEVLSVARSFAEMRSTRAPDPVPDASSSDTPETPAEPKVAVTKVPDQAPAKEPTKAPKPPKKPEVETSAVQPPSPKPRPAPKAPEPAEKKTAPGYNIGSVISRLAETGKIADPPAESDVVPPSGVAGNGQTARIPAPAPAPARPPGKPGDGYAAFQDAYRAAQAGDLEYAVQRYTDAIESKKLTLEHLGDAHFNRANVLHFLGRYDKSITDYGVTIGAKPNFAGAYYNRGFAYQAKGDRQQAVDDFRRARDLGLQRLGVRAPDRIPPLR